MVENRKGCSFKRFAKALIGSLHASGLGTEKYYMLDQFTNDINLAESINLLLLKCGHTPTRYSKTYSVVI